METIKIIVQGPSGSGKSAIGKVIHDALREKGFIVTVASSTTRSDSDNEKVLSAIRGKGTSFLVCERQSPALYLDIDDGDEDADEDE